MRRIAFAVPVVALLSFAQAVSAASTVSCTPGSFCAIAPIPNLTKGVTANSSGLALFLNNLYIYLIGIAAVLAIIQIIWAGIEIALNKDNVSTITDQKGKIYNALLGLLLVLSPALVFSLINPQILNLSLNMDPITAENSTAYGTATATSTTTTKAEQGKVYPDVASIPAGSWCYVDGSKGQQYYCTTAKSSCETTVPSGRSCTQYNTTQPY